MPNYLLVGITWYDDQKSHSITFSPSCYWLSDNINELKFKFGSGYRIYYSELDDIILLLLCGGDKKTQSKDIKMAKDYLNDYLQGEDHE